MPEVKIRNMDAADLPAVVEIDQRIIGRDRDWPQRASSHFRTFYPPLSFVAELEDKVIGFIMGDIRGAEYALPLSGWVDIMGVDPAFQGKGVGLKLMDAFVRSSRALGVKTRCFLREDNQRLQKFLKAAGFERGDMIDFVRGFNEP